MSLAICIVTAYFTAIGIAVIRDRHKNPHQQQPEPANADGGFGDPDQQPGPLDDTYHQLEDLYAAPAAERRPR